MSTKRSRAIKEGTDDIIVISKARQENRISGREKLNIFHTNARSLNNKMEELEAKVDSEEYDIVAVRPKSHMLYGEDTAAVRPLN